MCEQCKLRQALDDPQSSFTEGRRNQLVDILSTTIFGNRIREENAQDLILFLEEENNRIKTVYKKRLLDIANLAMLLQTTPE